MEKIDKITEIKIVNTFIPITDLLDKLKIDYRIDGNFLCPFHPNENTPSAHLYMEESDGGGKIWCYSEQRMYGSWNVLKIFYPNVNTNKLAIGIAKKFGLERIERELGELELNNDIPFMKELEQFKMNKISYKTLCEKISEYYI